MEKKKSHSTKHLSTNNNNIKEESLSASCFDHQHKATSSTSYQGNEGELKERTRKKPIKLAPLDLPADIRKAQLTKLKDVQIEAKMAAEKLATCGAIYMEQQQKKVRNYKQLEKLEKIRQAENAILENQKSSKSLQQQTSFLPINISKSIVNQKPEENSIPNKLLVPIKSISTKPEMVHEVQNYIADVIHEPTHKAIRDGLRIKQGKGCEGGTRGRSKPLKPSRLTSNNVSINEDFNIATQQARREAIEAPKLLNNGIRRECMK